MSIRFGFSLGLHIRNEDRTATAVKKEILSRIWWAVYSLDRTLSAITGRPSVGADIHSSTTLPLPISADDIDENIIEARFGRKSKWSSATSIPPLNAESSQSAGTVPQGIADNASDASEASEPANAGTFLIAIVRLGTVSNNILTQLYSPNAVARSWKEVQGSITRLAEDLDAWLSSLPTGLYPFNDNIRDHTMQQERNVLKTYYFSTKILICRPCLCRLDCRILSQTQSSINFNHKIAVQCVAAAKSIAACLPDDMVAWGKEIYKVFPWWSVVHYLMQSMAILLLEVCYEAEGISILPDVQKLVRWLRELSSTNRTAERAYSITLDLLKKLTLRTFKDPQTTQEISLLLSEQAIPSSSRTGVPGFTPKGFTGEALPQQLPLQQDPRPRSGTFILDPFDETLPSMGVFPGAADLPASGFFYDALYTHTSQANVFLTGFDQHNPLPFNLDDDYMEDVPGQEQ